MDKNICSACGTENEEEYKYCKNCGYDLNACEPEKETPKTETVYQNQFGEYIVNDYEGVSAEEMAVFIGKKGDKILPKFSKMQLTGSKVSWNWPAAVLGYIFGPMGSALWFFYRKMYKPAVILAVVGAIITIFTGIMSVGGGEIVPESAIEAFLSGDFEEMAEAFDEAKSSRTQTQIVLGFSASFINEITNIIACIITGIYGFYIYKKHCIRKITEYRVYQADSRFYKVGLASIGGGSGGMLTVGIILMAVSSSIVDFVSSIYSLILI